ncbi:MAG: hypothetical protein V2A55_00730 [Candidatus Jorgensenbacteria bacterium]
MENNEAGKLTEGFTCNLKAKPMEEWVQEKDEKECRPCMIAPLASHYAGSLEDAKAEPQLTTLKQAWETEDVLTIAKAMDTIKGEVGEDLKNELLTLDCFAQSFKSEEAADKQQ